MTADRRSRRLCLGSLGIAGIVVGHIGGYSLAYPDPHQRLLQLAHAGHSYWETAIIVALFGAVVAVLGEVTLPLARAREKTRAIDQPTVSAFWSRLAPGQVAAFTLLEVAERAYHGADPSAWTEASFWAALPVLLVSAWLGALLLRTASRVGEALARRATKAGCADGVAVWVPRANHSAPRCPSFRSVPSRAPPPLLVVWQNLAVALRGSDERS